MITILLADDHAMVRAGLRAILDRQRDLRVIAEAQDGAEAVRLALDLQPRVAVLDIGLPVLSGLDALERIKAHAPQVRVLILTGQLHDAFVLRALWGGASGYLLKESRAAELVQAIRRVARGELAFEGAGVQDAVMLSGGHARLVPPSHSTLTERERDVLRLVAAGYSNAEIGTRLGISPKTVDTHRTRVMDKLDLHSRADLTAYALREGYLVAS